MPDFVTPAKGLTEPTVGADNNTWGGILNTDFSLIDSALGGTVSISISGTTTSITSTQAQNTGYVFTGSLTALNTITWPAGFYGPVFITNSTSGNQLIQAGMNGGGYATILPNEAALLWSDGTNFNRISVLGPAPNILTNPFVEIDQANEGSSVSLSSGTAAYVVDGWQAAFHSSTAVVTAQRVADGPLTYPNSIKLTVSTGASVAAGDYLYVRAPIEANNIAETAFGNAAARTVAVTFWAKSSIGSYVMSGAIQNFAQTRSYPFNVTISSSATWTKCTVIVPGDVAGTWVTSGTGGGMYLVLTAAAGSTYQGTASTWAGSNYLGTSSNTNTILSTSSATFQISVAKLEVSPIPTPYGRINFEDEYARCQRFYEKNYNLGTAVATATSVGDTFLLGATGAGTAGSTVYFRTTKRATPSITVYSSVTGTSGKVADLVNSTDVTLTTSGPGMDGFGWFASPSAGSTAEFSFQWTADARL